MSFLNEYNESIGIVFQEPPPPSQFLSDAGAGEETTPYKGLSLSDLAAMYKEGRLSEADYRAELTARKTGEKAIEELVSKNAPDPNAPKPSQIKPPSMQGGAGLADYSSLSETDIVNKVKKGEWTPEQAENVLISSKGYSAGSAKETINAVRPAVKTAEQSAAERALEARGITSKLSEADIIKGAELKLWTPDEAYDALINLKEYTPAEAAAKLRLAGWKGGPGGSAPAAKPPLAGTPGELISQYRNAYGETPADTPGQLMARQARPTPQADPGAWVVSGAEAANPSMTYTRQAGGGAGLSGVMTPTVQRPTVMGYTPTAATGKTPPSGGMIRAEDGSMVPPSFYGKTDMAPIPADVKRIAKQIEASGRIPPSYVPGQPYPPPGWTGSGLASVAR